MTIELRRDTPLAPEVRALLDRHLTLMQAASPPESVHALPPEALAGPEVLFFTLREGDKVLAIGAVKAIAPGHHEIKSMHVLAEARGRGLARMMLDHLIAVARAEGATRISLETGAEPVFAPARALYAASGFAPCGPFGSYGPDPNSVFMTRVLDEPDP